MSAPARSALVTGGSSGIALAIARMLREEGFALTLASRTPEKVEAAAADLGAEAVACDVSKPEDCARVVAEHVERHGGLDVLVNSAGIGIAARIEDAQLRHIDRQLNINLRGLVLVTQAAIPHLRQRGGGWIVNVSSLASKNPFAGGAAYCASKAGVNAFSEALMQELRFDNIRVTYVLPGSVATGFSGREPAAGADWKLRPEDVAQAIADVLNHPARSLPSRIEIRPSRPMKS